MNNGNYGPAANSYIQAQPSPKPYKSKDPFTTINEIRSILEECNIFTLEYPYPPADNFHSCGVFLSDHKVGDIQVGFYGKGMTAKYSLASAYAEFMERLQNNVLFANSYASLFPLKAAQKKFLSERYENSKYAENIRMHELELDFVFGPDEQTMSRSEILASCKPILQKIFKTELDDEIENLFIDKELICAPFFNFFNEKVEMLPIELIYRASVSNGMCAGNTPEEALLHGICEVFERYAVYSIYNEELTPPTIPIEVFVNTEVYQLVQYLEQYKNLKVIIKDCSLGKNLPVMGVLVIDQANNKYTFNLGADPSPVIAVERCLMEMYQGGPNIHYTPIDLSTDPFSPNGKTREQLKSSAFYQNLFTGTGVWPNSIFDNNDSYPFSGFGFRQGKSDKEDLATAFELVKNLGYEVYVRDCSYLGFPTYLVYIPGMSEGKHSFTGESVYAMSKLEKHIETLHNLSSIQPETVRELAETLDELSRGALPFSFEIRKVLLRTGPTQIDNIESDLFIALLFLSVGEYEKTLEYTNHYFRKHPGQEPGKHIFYLGIRDILKLKIEGKDDTEIKVIITNLYGEANTRSILGEFLNASTIFQRMSVSTCFDCEDCKVRQTCAHFDVLQHVKIIQKKQKEKNLNQEDLKDILAR